MSHPLTWKAALYKATFGWVTKLLREMDWFFVLFLRWVWWPVLPLIVLGLLFLEYALVWLWVLIPLADTVFLAWPLARVFQELNRRLTNELVRKGELDPREIEDKKHTPPR